MGRLDSVGILAHDDYPTSIEVAGEVKGESLTVVPDSDIRDGETRSHGVVVGDVASGVWSTQFEGLDGRMAIREIRE
jgi:hypothetical protein